MNVLDLFAGLGGWSAAFRDRGHDIVTLDNDSRFGCNITQDIREPFDLPWTPDIILASPPCETFSVMSIGTHWTGGRRAYIPRTDAARTGIALVERTRFVIEHLQPSFWIIENPRGVLRKLGILGEPMTIWACHYGAGWAKPTDLWGGFPPSLVLEPKCHNRRPDHPDGCCCHDHPAAPRGARAGIQGVGGVRHSRLREAGHTSAAERAKIPAALSLAVCLAAERDL